MNHDLEIDNNSTSSPLSIDDDLETLDVDVPDEIQSFDISAAQEETRAKIALNFTNIFLLLVALSLILPFVANFIFPQTFNNPLDAAKELLTILASVLAGPFGFIVGFYFKQTLDK